MPADPREAFRAFVTDNCHFYNTAHERIDIGAAEELFCDPHARSVIESTVYSSIGEIRIVTDFTVIDLNVAPLVMPVLYETVALADAFVGMSKVRILGRYHTAQAAALAHYDYLPHVHEMCGRMNVGILSTDSARGPLYPWAHEPT